jgi:hypothetical protein
MTLHRLEGPPSPSLARALADFEAQFTYPLGPGRTFRISHGEDYGLFFRSMGTASSFIYEHDGRVLGVLGVAVRPLLLPDRSEKQVAYFGDLKTAKEARGGVVLHRLVSAAMDWLRPQVDAGYAVVMDGTPVIPEAYTGRAGIPLFRELGKVTVLRVILPRIPAELPSPTDPVSAVEESALVSSFRELSGGRYANLGGNAHKRSQIPAMFLKHLGGGACGRLEDTRRGKRLIADDGSEMISAHLSCFAYRDVESGAAIVREAAQRAVRLGFPALFTAVPVADSDALCTSLSSFEIIRAPATIFGTALAPGFDWNIHTSEI